MKKNQLLREIDKRRLWHPFTQMQDWCADDNHEDPLVIQSGKGAVLTDVNGNEYIDGNSSIWTNIHGHRHPVIDAAIRAQLLEIAHCSALGFSNRPAIQLAEKLVSFFPKNTLSRVFYSDDGSTAVECACKMAIQFRQQTGQPDRTRFISFDGAYHGDTAGAASLGGIGLFHQRFSFTGFQVTHLDSVAALLQLDQSTIKKTTALVIEPLIQGAAGMRLWPEGMLHELRNWCDENDVFLMLDEVMTGFGRTGTLFACEQESVVPDFCCLAKGLTGGYLPLAATLTTEKVFEAFLGSHEEQKTFFYGHSYCANPLGCAAALGNLKVFEEESVLEKMPKKSAVFHQAIEQAFCGHPAVREIRQIGLIAGIEIAGFNRKEQIGGKICLRARKYGLLTRPIGEDTLVLMPPLCVTEEEITKSVAALLQALNDVVGG